MGFTPVLYGDAVLDTKRGFTILSGDQLVSALAVKFNAKSIVIGLDEDGVFDSDPKLEKTAQMYDHLTLEELRKLVGRLGKTTACDVTGGMYGKVVELIPVLDRGIKVKLVNAKTANRLYKVLIDEEVAGTKIEPSER
jgi:isopentenyl phosphate kinase